MGINIDIISDMIDSFSKFKDNCFEAQVISMGDADIKDRITACRLIISQADLIVNKYKDYIKDLESFILKYYKDQANIHMVKSELDACKVSLEKIGDINSIIFKIKDGVDSSTNDIISYISQVLQEYKKSLNSLIDELKSDKEDLNKKLMDREFKISQLESKLNQLQSCKEDLNRKLEDRDGRISQLESELQQLKISGYEGIVMRASQLLDMVEENRKAMIVSDNIKNRKGNQMGELNPAFKQNIKTEDLIKDYTDAGYIITEDMVKKYGATYGGIRDRLIKAGVYKHKWGKNKHIDTN